MYLINLICIFIFLSTGTYFDIKYRKIPNKFLKIMILPVCFLIILEMIFYKSELIFYILIRFLIITTVFIIMFLLFMFRLIGGGDAKVILLYFSCLSINFWNGAFLLYFTFLYVFFVLLMVFYNFLINSKSNNKESFKSVFSLYNSIKPNRFRLKSTCRFIKLSELYKHEKIVSPSKKPIIIYNRSKNELQILIKYVFPFMIAHFFSNCVILIMIAIN